MKRYLIVIQQTGSGYSTYSPDLSGCVSTGKSRDEVEKNMREAIEFHIDRFAQSRVSSTRASSLFVLR
jgi:predicted RNase H-like HicB family nuclease